MNVTLVKDVVGRLPNNKLLKGSIFEVEENHKKNKRYLIKNNHQYWYVSTQEAKPVK